MSGKKEKIFELAQSAARKVGSCIPGDKTRQITKQGRGEQQREKRCFPRLVWLSSLLLEKPGKSAQAFTWAWKIHLSKVYYLLLQRIFSSKISIWTTKKSNVACFSGGNGICFSFNSFSLSPVCTLYFHKSKLNFPVHGAIQGSAPFQPCPFHQRPNCVQPEFKILDDNSGYANKTSQVNRI